MELKFNHTIRNNSSNVTYFFLALDTRKKSKRPISRESLFAVAPLSSKRVKEDLGRKREKKNTRVNDGESKRWDPEGENDDKR